MAEDFSCKLWPHMHHFSSHWIAQTLNLPQEASLPQRTFSHITSDSRKVGPDSLFIALRGEKFNGHAFIHQAIDQGATGILCEQIPTDSTNTVAAEFFVVPDGLAAYRRLAAAWRAFFSIPVIAVAGSVGKTTVKELLGAIFLGKYTHVLKTQGSQNGYLGLAITLLELRAHHEIAVIEIGIDEIHAMQEHLELVRPTACILTAIQEEHLEKLQSLEIVAREECLALTWVAQHQGICILNGDDPLIRSHAVTLKGGTPLVFSLTPSKGGFTLPQAQTLRGEVHGDQLQTLGWHTETPVFFTLPLLGIHNARNLLGAITTAFAHGLTPPEIQKGLSQFQGAAGRTQIQKLSVGLESSSLMVICDYYNASPASTRAGLALIQELPARERWICLGDMLELGPEELEFHRQLAEVILPSNIHHVLLYGPRMQALHQTLLTRSSETRALQTVQHFDTHEEMAQALATRVQAYDCILIKGSRGMKMERVWEILQNKFKNSAESPS